MRKKTQKRVCFPIPAVVINAREHLFLSSDGKVVPTPYSESIFLWIPGGLRLLRRFVASLNAGCVFSRCGDAVIRFPRSLHPHESWFQTNLYLVSGGLRCGLSRRNTDSSVVPPFFMVEE